MQGRIARRTFVTATAFSAALTLAACSGGTPTPTTTGGAGSASGATVTRGGTLVIAGGVTPNLDPSTLAPPYGWPVMDTLLHVNMKGEDEPDLATKVEYADTTNTKVRITLREGVTFSNGEAFNAAAVVGSMKRFLAQPGPVTISAGPIAEVAADGENAVVITYKQALPLKFVTNSLNQTHSFGMILAPASVKDEKSIAANPIGVGPYKVDTATSNSSTYVYVPNESYFNKDAITYDKVVIRVIPDAAAQLAALQSGQVQWATSVAPAAVDAAKAAGVKIVTSTGDTSAYISLINRGTGPLADIKVRQAISYAMPREDIVKAVFAGRGTPTSSLGVPGGLGYDEANVNAYTYDVAKAKALLAEAGYANGFTMTTLTTSATSNLAQAMASALKEVGITLNVEVNSGSFPEFMAALASKKYDSSVGANPAMDAFTLYTYTLPKGQTNNTFEVDHPELDTMIADAAKKPAAEQDAAYIEVIKYLDEQAWVVPVALTTTVQGVSSKVKNVPDQVASVPFLLNPFSPVTDQNWSGS